MDKSKAFGDKWSALSKIVDIWNIIIFLSGIGTGGSTEVAALSHIPVYYSIIGGVISVA